MALNKICLVALMAVAASARPQATELPLDADGIPFNPNPVYTYSYQVSDDPEQTYIQKEESRDGDEVTGSYQYVDPLGQLIKVTYFAGVMGYTEEREVIPNFVTINERPAADAVSVVSTSSSSTSSSASSGNSFRSSTSAAAPAVSSVRTVTQQAAAPARSAVQETVTTRTSEAGNSDLIARILAQLTPLIQTTVSNSLSSTGGTVTTRRVVSSGSSDSGSAGRSATVVRRVQAAAPVVRTVTTSTSSGFEDLSPRSDSAVTGIFGTGGNTIAFTNPDISYDFDFDTAPTRK